MKDKTSVKHPSIETVLQLVMSAREIGLETRFMMYGEQTDTFAQKFKFMKLTRSDEQQGMEVGKSSGTVARSKSSETYDGESTSFENSSDCGSPLSRYAPYSLFAFTIQSALLTEFC